MQLTRKTIKHKKGVKTMLDEKLKKEIRDITAIMRKMDRAGRAMLLHDATLLIARQEIEKSQKQPA